MRERAMGRCSLLLSLTLLIAVTSPAARADTPTDTAIAEIRASYERDVRPIVARSCVACHDSQARPEGFLGHLPGIRQLEWRDIHRASKVLDFSRVFPSWSPSTANAHFFLDQIGAMVAGNKMPTLPFRIAHYFDGRRLKPAGKRAILDWVEASRRLLASAEHEPVSAPGLFRNRCYGCHNPTTNDGSFAMRLVNDQLVIPDGTAGDESIPYVTAHDPMNSAVYLVLLADPARRHGLPHMPRNSAAFSEQEQAIVFDWIKR